MRQRLLIPRSPVKCIKCQSGLISRKKGELHCWRCAERWAVMERNPLIAKGANQ